MWTAQNRWRYNRSRCRLRCPSDLTDAELAPTGIKSAISAILKNARPWYFCKDTKPYLCLGPKCRGRLLPHRRRLNSDGSAEGRCRNRVGAVDPSRLSLPPSFPPMCGAIGNGGSADMELSCNGGVGKSLLKQTADLFFEDLAEADSVFT